MPISCLRALVGRSLQRVLLAVAGSVSLTATVRGDDPPRPPAGEVRLESGRVAQYTIHFNRNSLRYSVRLNDGLIALTSSGTLLRFEMPAVRLIRERIGTDEVTCLGRGEGEAVLAGLSDGRICRVDPGTLDLSDIGKLPEAPQWVGWAKAQGNRPAGLVAVIRLTKPVQQGARQWLERSTVVHDLAMGTRLTMGEAASTILLDRSGRLWLGADNGEWAGHVSWVDLPRGTLSKVKPPPNRKPDHQPFWHGVYGLIELADGQVWAFGGMSHMGVNSAFITRIDGDEPRPLFETQPAVTRAEDRETGRPRVPITHIAEEVGSLVVFSYSEVFRVDKKLTTWKKLATLGVSYRGGRPDAVSAYPAVRVVHSPRRDGEPYVFATVGDGYVTLDEAKSTSHRLPGQLSASGIHRVENTSEGTIVSEFDERLPSWRLGAKGWEVAAIAPPMEPDPANALDDFEKEQGGWYDTRMLVGPKGVIYTVSATATSPGTRTTARRVDGKSERLGRETSSLNPSASILTADGTLWNAFFGELKRLEKGRWMTVAPLPEEKSPFELESVNTNGPPWLLIDRFLDNLWRLEHGANGDKPQLTVVDLQEGGRTLRIADAITWSDARLLLATDAGLRAYHINARKLTRVDFPEPKTPATALVQDRRGRLWLGSGSGLWLAQAGEKTLESFDRVPWVGRNEVFALAPDPQHDDGVIVALGPRGVAFVRAVQRP
jgi:hypothetical protein